MDKDKRKLSKLLSNYFAAIGRKGARARAAKFSKKRRNAIAKAAAAARWSKSKRRKS